ncbi:MAG: hypothetical protein V4850_02995 [Myxococcota bacterium]
MRAALATVLGASPAMTRIDAALARHADMAVAITREVVDVRATLDAARERADRTRRAGWHYVYVAAWMPELALDPRVVYPATSAGRKGDTGEGLAALDEAGAVEAPGVGGADAGAAVGG